MSWKVLLAIGAALMIIVSWTAIRGRAALPTTDNATEKLVIRQIGHQLLLQAGDSSSRILASRPISTQVGLKNGYHGKALFTLLSSTSKFL